MSEWQLSYHGWATWRINMGFEEVALFVAALKQATLNMHLQYQDMLAAQCFGINSHTRNISRLFGEGVHVELIELSANVSSIGGHEGFDLCQNAHFCKP